MVAFRSRFVGCAVGSIVLCQIANAQQNAAVFPVPPAPASQHGSEIFSTPVDPFMSREQEQRILKTLRGVDTTAWENLSIADLRRELAPQLTVWVDRTEIELLGCDPDHLLGSNTPPVGPLGVRLECLLAPLELVYSVCGNRLVITSRDDEESDPPIRMYDVTPLVHRIVRNQRSYDFTGLANTIQQTVAPDGWLQAGGCSTIMNEIVGLPGKERGMLIIACSTSSHLKIQSLLDNLNQAHVTSNELDKSQSFAPRLPFATEAVSRPLDAPARPQLRS